MLYLNADTTVTSEPIGLYLTLTNVVFEFLLTLKCLYVCHNLTLTNVVFEWGKIMVDCFSPEFNFNKCCIWIPH